MIVEFLYLKFFKIGLWQPVFLPVFFRDTMKKMVLISENRNGLWLSWPLFLCCCPALMWLDPMTVFEMILYYSLSVICIKQVSSIFSGKTHFFSHLEQIIFLSLANSRGNVLPYIISLL